MRLIDADYITKGRVRNDPVVIAAKCAPTIDAIPMEWLNNVMLTGDAEESKAAWRMLHKWNDEHFADIGKMQNL